MIQSAHIKNIEPKASPKAKVKAEGEVKSKANGVENKDDGEDFASELKASLSTEEVELKVKPVEVSQEQMLGTPSATKKTPESDSVSPKVFDSALILGVDKIIQPETTEVPVELTNEQI